MLLPTESITLVCVYDKVKDPCQVVSLCVVHLNPNATHTHRRTSNNCVAQQSNMMICMRRKHDGMELFAMCLDEAHALTTHYCVERRPLCCIWYNSETGKNEAEVLMGTAERPKWKTDDTWKSWSRQVGLEFSKAGRAGNCRRYFSINVIMDLIYHLSVWHEYKWLNYLKMRGDLT